MRTLLLTLRFEIPIIKLSSDSSIHSISDSFESATFTTLLTGRLLLFAPDTDDDAALTTALTLAQDHIPSHSPGPAPEAAPVPCGPA